MIFLTNVKDITILASQFIFSLKDLKAYSSMPQKHLMQNMIRLELFHNLDEVLDESMYIWEGRKKLFFDAFVTTTKVLLFGQEWH